MKQNQQANYKDAEVALFPMDYLNITQGRYGNFSHAGYNATDLAGKDGGIDMVYAPFTLKVEWVDTGAHKTGAVVSNSKEVVMANGMIMNPRTILMMLWHDNNISNLFVGQEIAQGVNFYDEGTAGQATGNHVHLELAYGVYEGGYPLEQLSNGYWTLKGTELNIEDAFYVNDTVLKNNGGYHFKEWIAPVEPEPESEKSIEQLAQEVLKGVWGNDPTRTEKLTAAGYDAVAVQIRVNDILGLNGKTIETLAREVIRGDWGNGQERVIRLTEAGYNYDVVQARVNELI